MLEEVGGEGLGLAGQSVAPQTRSVRQHPPLREAGQDLKAVGQMTVVLGAVPVKEGEGVGKEVVVEESWETVG